MPNSGPEPLDGMEWLRAIRELESRVARIEESLNLAPAGKAQPLAERTVEPGATILAESASAVPVLGRALLALAGAYVLRALTDSHTVPQSAGVLSGIAYAAFWLVWAARIVPAHRAETTLYSLTSALILGPLLYEATLRMKVMAAGTAAAVLFAFTIFGLILSWRKNLLIVSTIAILASTFTAAALLIGSQDVIPFVFLSLAIAAAVETSACLDHWLSERWITALAADLVILLATYLVTNEQGLPPGYAPVPHWLLLAAQLLLPTIYLSSTMIRTLRSGLTITVFETAQIGAALLLALGGGLRVSGDHLFPVLPVFCLIASGASYGAACRMRARNLQIFAAFGLLLLLGGTRLVLPAGTLADVWLVLSVVFFAAVRPALAWHGFCFLVFALGASNAVGQAAERILGSAHPQAAPTELLGQTVAALACYALFRRRALPSQALAVALSGIAFWMTSAVVAGTLAKFVPAAYSATVRTALLAWGAVLLAWSGRFWKRTELSSLAYLATVLGAYRLLGVDLANESRLPIILSLVAFGAALMVLPRFLRRVTDSSSRPQPAASRPKT